jgi:serine/threonine protein kinase, bacterial
VLAGLAITRSPQASTVVPQVAGVQSVASPAVSSSEVKPSASSTVIVQAGESKSEAPVRSVDTPKPSKPQSTVTRPNAGQFVRDHYGEINDRNYDKSWQNLSSGFQRDKAKGYGSYTDWWNSVERVQINAVTVGRQDGNSAEVDANLRYVMKDGGTDVDSSQLYLEWNGDRQSWEIVDKVRS